VLCAVSFLLPILGAGCDRTMISGMVTDVQGTPLPGVAVIADAADAQTITNALGRYDLTAPRGIAGIRLVKDGYTSGYLALENGTGLSVTAQTVALWPLPRGAGAYLVENYHFRAMTPGEPKPFATETGPVYAMRVVATITTTDQPKPLVICHKMPAYDLRLARLRHVKATGPEGGFDVWAAESNSPVEALPIDEPERVLVEIRLADNLIPGTYALHWGALDGRTSIESRAFLFTVQDPDRPAEPAPVSEAKTEKRNTTQEKSAVSPAENVDTTAADAEAEAPPR